jgi:hypothetical protein
MLLPGHYALFALDLNSTRWRMASELPLSFAAAQASATSDRGMRIGDRRRLIFSGPTFIGLFMSILVIAL